LKSKMICKKCRIYKKYGYCVLRRRHPVVCWLSEYFGLTVITLPISLIIGILLMLGWASFNYLIFLVSFTVGVALGFFTSYLDPLRKTTSLFEGESR